MITQHLPETPVVNRWILGLSILGFHGLFQRTFGLCKSSALGKNWDQLVAAVIPMESYGYNVKPVVRWFSMNSKVFVSKFHADNFSGWEKVKVRDLFTWCKCQKPTTFFLGTRKWSCPPGGRSPPTMLSTWANTTTSTKNLRSKMFC